MLRETLRATNGKIFRVHFIKRSTGELRKMSCRLGVRKGLVNPTAGPDPKLVEQDLRNDLMRVYDCEKQAYRSIPLEGVSYVKCGEIEWTKAS